MTIPTKEPSKEAEPKQQAEGESDEQEQMEEEARRKQFEALKARMTRTS